MRAHSLIDTDTFEEKYRIQMCEDASKIDSLADKKIEFLTDADADADTRTDAGTDTNPETDADTSRKTGQKTCYTLITEEYPDDQELALAFQCLTKPRMFLQLHHVNETVFVIVKKSELLTTTSPSWTTRFLTVSN